MISNDAIKDFASSIMPSEVITYVEDNKENYEIWLNKNNKPIDKKEEDKKEDTQNEIHRT